MFGILTNSLFETLSMMCYVCVNWSEIVKGWLTLHSACQQLISWKDQYSRGQWAMMKKTNVHVRLAFFSFWRTNVRQGQQFLHLCLSTQRAGPLKKWRLEKLNANIWRLQCIMQYRMLYRQKCIQNMKYWSNAEGDMTEGLWRSMNEDQRALAPDWCPKMSISWLPWEKKNDLVV